MSGTFSELAATKAMTESFYADYRRLAIFYGLCVTDPKAALADYAELKRLVTVDWLLVGGQLHTDPYWYETDPTTMAVYQQYQAFLQQYFYPEAQSGRPWTSLRDPMGRSSLAYACRYTGSDWLNQLKLITLLSTQDLTAINQPDISGVTPLIELLLVDNSSTESLLTFVLTWPNVDVNYIDLYGDSILTHVCRRQSEQLLTALMTRPDLVVDYQITDQLDQLNQSSQSTSIQPRFGDYYSDPLLESARLGFVAGVRELLDQRLPLLDRNQRRQLYSLARNRGIDRLLPPTSGGW